MTEAKKKEQENKKGFGVKVFKKPREWLYETKPLFKKIRGPLVDVFKEAEEIRIVIDLSGFKTGEVDIDIRPDRYIIKAFKQEQTFREEVLFPKDVDTDNVEEHFRNGILELVLPRKNP
ncbi:MAG: Hsp20/alpha crystallin family protein [Deltaproteobacteria bacterium]|nr:Hsp20/alpha crystallin family protein [Deltaproteobacteria bacterium]